VHILITGGAGFIGSHLVELHLARGDKVHVVDDLSTGSMDNVKPFLDQPNFHFDAADLLTWQQLERVAAWADRIYHLAAVAAAGAGWWYRVPISEWLDRNAPNRGQILGWWSTFESWGAEEIAPLLKRIGLRVPPELVIDALALLVVLLLVRNLYASVVRSRNRRAYARAQARNSA
jgi:NAD(P)-dependent dehydrogenase (short-subunit alcohol dehydrogenase family)